jgi:tetratricopeptide (TPR) repeat protein
MEQGNLKQVEQLLKEGSAKEANQLLDKLIMVHGKTEETVYLKAICNYKLQKFNISIELFTLLINDYGNNPAYISERGLAYFMMGRMKDAMNDFDEAVRLEPENPYRYASRAFIKDRIGNLEGSLSDYNMALALDPEDAISYNNRGLVEEKLGYKEKAQKSFEQADKLSGVETSAKGKELKIKETSKKIELEEEKIKPSESLEKINEEIETLSKFGIAKKVFTDKITFKEFVTFVKELFTGPKFNDL